MTHVVIGAGEVGRAIAAVLSDRYPVVLRDIDGEATPADVLHICFPWSDGFADAVRTYVIEYDPVLVIIHSTVPVGTSRALNAVHSPVTGRHPHLKEGVRTFVKFFGGENAEPAAALFEACGVRVAVTEAQETTEAGKLWATLQYGWMIALQKEIYRFCGWVGADPSVAYGDFNRAYNEGYAEIGQPFRLPVLADMPGPIGGHCVIPNARLMNSHLADTLIDLNETW